MTVYSVEENNEAPFHMGQTVDSESWSLSCHRGSVLALMGLTPSFPHLQCHLITELS